MLEHHANRALASVGRIFRRRVSSCLVDIFHKLNPLRKTRGASLPVDGSASVSPRRELQRISSVNGEIWTISDWICECRNRQFTSRFRSETRLHASAPTAYSR
ncbi:hypothetical protein Bxe_C1154 [Paraburkholderia xenovorans LB400]|uniref:Uncharacterized protein n=1 Tax=Paraburkholderia xenovorans (strain LB400) TaxID=266265 RepID=Q13FX0_PARXL|nr:hypothetical protein Bxe_C1154 [Paraburkholderia xenovorans LB400]